MPFVQRPHFYIYSSGYNCQSHVAKCLRSVDQQTYENYTHVVIDDCSTDNTYETCLNFPNSRRIVRTNSLNLKWLGNAALHLKPVQEDIVVILDLDDRLHNPKVLEILSQIYIQEDIWLSYGNYSRESIPDVIWPHCRAFPDAVLRERTFRKYGWITSHLRTFKGFLWNNLCLDDFKDAAGLYAPMAYDIAIMFPMLEMCQRGKIRYIPELLYVYNDLNPINDHKVNRQLQLDCDSWFRSKPSYPVL